MLFLGDVLAEFAKIRLKDGVYSSKLGTMIKNGNKKVFAFTNKKFNKEYYKDSLIPRVIGYQKNPIGANIASRWNLPHDTLEELTSINPNLTKKEIQKELDFQRVGRIKTTLALEKIKRNNKGKFPEGKTTSLSRYIDVPNNKLEKFLQDHTSTNDVNDLYYHVKNKKLRFKNNTSTSLDNNGDDFYGGYGRGLINDSTKIQYMIKPKKNKSKGRYVSHYLDDNEESSEVLFPSTTKYKVKHIKKTPEKFRTDKNMEQYNIRLDEI